MLRIVYGKTWAYDPVPSSVYRCNNPESYSRSAGINEMRLTVKFRTLLKHQINYSIPDSMLISLARTAMSKAITNCDSEARQRVRELVNPYLSKSQQIFFTIANQSPLLYQLGNTLRHYLKGKKYGPRQVISSATANQNN
jgi:hypothetical protein